MSSSSVFLLNVKFSSSTAFQIETTKDDTIADLKRKLVEKSGLSAEDVQLILAGKVLKNDSVLKDLQIGDCTVLHAFQQKRDLPSVQAENNNFPLDNSQASEQHEFFVYCKKCKSLQPGKLRVACAKCKQGQIILDTLNREPQGFDDVLEIGVITGECKSAECQTRQNAQFYFKCSRHQSDFMDNELDQSEAVLQHIRPNRRCVECVTCSEITSPVLKFPCQSHHPMCLDCFTNYCIVQLSERRFVEDPNIGYSLPCPAGCPDSLIKDAHHFCLLGDEQYERYKNFGVEEFVLQNGGLICPAIGCGTGFLLENSNRKITCPACRSEFCRDCRRDYHVDGEECNTHTVQQAAARDQEQDMIVLQDRQSLDTIEKISKPCPNCKTKTERSGGCMHMKCSRCGEDWCWMCNIAWNRGCQGNHWFG